MNIISHTGLSPSLVWLPNHFCYHIQVHITVLQPRTEVRFGLFPFRSPLLRESLRFLFLWLLRCFTSPGIALLTYFIQLIIIYISIYWVSPFGNHRIIASYQLPGAYRRFARPSSPTSPKAFTISP